MIRSIIRILSVLSFVGLLLTVSVWFMQRSGPVPIFSGPQNLGVTWQLYKYSSSKRTSWWTGFPSTFERRFSGELVAVIPKSQVLPLLSASSLLVGFAYGRLDIGRAFYYPVQDGDTKAGYILLSDRK